ncbi:MAG: ATP-binding protein [Halodesulfurarchaeum sp.]|nr:ATP-binding protein [Halodesulfurarchaeum sp.]
MNLNELTIENFRGVKGTFERSLDGENVIIVGPNGSGKSSILEAIDFLLTNRVTHLSGEGSGAINETEVIPNVDAEGPCVVSASFQDAETEQRIRRTAEVEKS